MQTITITLAGKEYEIRPLPLRRADAWRASLNGPFAELVQTLEGAESIELNNARDLAALVKTLSATVVDSPRLIRERLFAYAPNLAEDANFILDNAYDEEIFEAFLEVLKLAYPFGRIAGIFNSPRGRTSEPTGRKSS